MMGGPEQVVREEAGRPLESSFRPMISDPGVMPGSWAQTLRFVAANSGG